MKITELVPTIETCRRLCALRERPIVNFMWVAGKDEPYVAVVFVDSNEEKMRRPYTDMHLLEFIDGIEFVPAPTVSESALEIQELELKHMKFPQSWLPKFNHGYGLYKGKEGYYFGNGEMLLSENMAEAYALQVIEIYEKFEPKKQNE